MMFTPLEYKMELEIELNVGEDWSCKECFLGFLLPSIEAVVFGHLSLCNNGTITR